jgi:Putative endonuclease segE, GIY-YIG domain
MWLYKKKEFKESMIPENAIGFIYVMTVIINGVLYKYIGKKNFYSDVKTKLKKNEVSLDKRIKKYKRVRKFTYENYYSSNLELKEAHKKKINIKREILLICFSASELTYQEVKHQFKYEVLEKKEFLNGNILGRFYKIK